MPMRFEWDREKAAASFRRHGVSFEEATTAFDDPLSATVSDPDHSMEEERFILLGQTNAGRLIVVAHTDRGDHIRIISAREADSFETMKKAKGKRPNRASARRSDDELRSRYDFRHGVRGKYVARYREGTNVVVLDPDVAARFPDAAAVNAALRSIEPSGPQPAKRPASKRRSA